MIINNNKEFELEDFLNEELEYSKMTPSAAVWDKINKEIRPQYRWALWMLTLLMLFVPYSLVMYYMPAKNGQASASKQSTTAPNNSQIASTLTIKLNQNKNLSTQSIIAAVEQLKSTITIDESGVVEGNNNSDTYAASGNSATLKANPERIQSTNMSLPSLYELNLPFINVKDEKEISAKSGFLKKKTPAKISIEVYATPSISYRNLSDDKTRLQYYRDIYRNNPFTDNIAAKNVNTVVNQKAGFGKEIGIGTRYNLNSRLKLKAGLQFNVQQFSSEAYQTTGTANFAYVKNNMLDSVSANALYATTGTNKVDLNNKLYQLSIPLGIQWDVIQNKKFSLGLGASLQPTFLLQDDTYVVSTDYKYFSKGSKFSKNWNLNSAVDLSFNYSNKDFIWYFAPQFRYQLGTTYQDIYSIKEHRWDLGLKIGVVKTF